MNNQLCTRFDAAGPALVITDLTVTDPAIIAESRRWSTGQRGPTVGPAELLEIDLSPFVRQALAVGVQAICAAGSARDKLEFAQLVDDLGTKTGQAAQAATDATTKVVTEASTAMQKAAHDAKVVLYEAQRTAETRFAENVRLAQTELQANLSRLFGGDDPELLARLQPVLIKFGTDLQQTGAAQTQAMIEKAGRLFDTDNPASPMAKHARLLEQQQADLKATIAANQEQTSGKLLELTTAVNAVVAGRDAAAKVRSMTTLKGAAYEAKINTVMHEIALGMGDEYQETGTQPGRKGASKKGDGVLRVAESTAAVVIEATDSGRKDWIDYLSAAEITRGAQASLGLVPHVGLLNDVKLRCFGPRRVVMAFDPDTDDPDLLRAMLQLLRLSALAAASRASNDAVDSADEKLAEALSALTKIAEIEHGAQLIKRHANTVTVAAAALHETLERLLTEARTALAVGASAALSKAA